MSPTENTIHAFYRVGPVIVGRAYKEPFLSDNSQEIAKEWEELNVSRREERLSRPEFIMAFENGIKGELLDMTEAFRSVLNGEVI